MILYLKLADIAPVMISTIEPFINIGVNEAIAHAFIGLNGGLQELKEKYLDKKCKAHAGHLNEPLGINRGHRSFAE